MKNKFYFIMKTLTKIIDETHYPTVLDYVTIY